MGTGLDHLLGTIKRKAGWLTNDVGVEHEGKREQLVADVETMVDEADDAPHHAAQERDTHHAGKEPANP
jgi:uncharacterized protein YjbJ (UPF0337 family)